MAIKKLFLTFLFFITINVYGADKIHNISFEGLERISSSSMLSIISVKIGDIIDSNKIKNIIKSLYSTNNFEAIKVTKNSNTLIIKVKELPIISKITIVGNNLIKKDRIEKSLDTFNVFAGAVLNKSLISLINKSFEEFYFNIGKYNFNINTVITPLSNNYVDVKFIFNEGNFSKIYQINIIGNKKFNSNKLISLFELRDKTTWWNIIKNRRYQKQKLEKDLMNLRNFYLSNGYLRFKIKSTKLSLTPDKKGIFITINLHEGNQYKISGIKFKSNLNNNLKNINNLKNLIKIPVGDLYNINKIQQAKDRIKQSIIGYGYSYPNIIIHYKIDDINNKVQLFFDSNIGHIYYVRQIYFKGNYISRDSVLRRKIQQMEGTWLNSDLVNQSTDLLKRTGYFETVELEKKISLTCPDQVDLIYKVKEKNTGGIKLGVGYGKTNNLNFQAKINQNNWLGTGNMFSINASREQGQSQGDILLVNPYFTLNGISLSNHIFYSILTDYKYYGYNDTSYGVDTSIGIPITTHSTLHLGLGYTKNDIYNIKSQISIYRYLKSVTNDGKISKFLTKDFNFNYGWTYDTLNQNILPSMGNYTHLSGKNTFLKSINNFFKVSLDVNQYIPISSNKNWILSGHGYFGYGMGFKSHEMPFYENFYAGGPKSIRGFQNNGIGPKSVYLKGDISSDCISKGKCLLSNDTVGGNATFTGSFELIFPIPFIEEKYLNSIRTSLFFDFGNVWDTMWTNTIDEKNIDNLPNYNSPENIRMSAGISLEWASPFGPLVFSYAIPIKKYTGDKVENFQFYAGKTW
ncbi:outer membrane protein assembly factor BamA [Candidatus Pantoea edessiphila]|uniref:Outer membrane protein assembly factor BamA n=1 Tax=Candidatus Pantoea edessiphila TaxID=2044610 RepID=A0A2P5T086_9GAMM|nr:outer membrane protein assembly factor BamA [Candidatus Pantoea edessiphila]PPI88004.1 outer membrane protein assembly factor BamA [Candidatus Pantoea edessiphila]